MRHIQRLSRELTRLIRRLDLDDIPPAALLFFGGALLLALIGYFDWRGDTKLLADGREIPADVIDRRVTEEVDCDSDDTISGCTTDYTYFITYQYQVDGQTYNEERAVDSDIYYRTESVIHVRYLPDRPSVSDVSETVKNELPFPLSSLVVIIFGLIGSAVIIWIQT